MVAGSSVEVVFQLSSHGTENLNYCVEDFISDDLIVKYLNMELLEASL